MEQIASGSGIQTPWIINTDGSGFVTGSIVNSNSVGCFSVNGSLGLTAFVIPTGGVNSTKLLVSATNSTDQFNFQILDSDNIGVVKGQQFNTYPAGNSTIAGLQVLKETHPLPAGSYNLQISGANSIYKLKVYY